jgi:hypothetical protein
VPRFLTRPRSSLPFHAPLHPADGSRIGTQFRTQRLEPGLGFPRHDGNAGRTQVQADGVAADHVLGLVVRCACQRQLHKVALPLSVGALCAWTGGGAADQAGVLDLVRQAMGDHRVTGVDERGQPVVVPQQEAELSSVLLHLQHKAQTRIVALVLQTGEPAAPALEAHASGFAHADPVERAVGAGGQCLGQHGIQVLCQPRDPQLFRQLVKGVLGKAEALSQGREGCPALQCECPGNGAGRPAWAGSAFMRRRRRCPAQSTAL